MAVVALVEQPFRGTLAQRLRPGRWVLAGAVVLLCAAGIQTVLYLQAPRLSLSTVSRHPADWYPNGKSVAGDYPECALVVAKHRFRRR